jgi:hypothetical protein
MDIFHLQFWNLFLAALLFFSNILLTISINFDIKTKRFKVNKLLLLISFFIYIPISIIVIKANNVNPICSAVGNSQSNCLDLGIKSFEEAQIIMLTKNLNDFSKCIFVSIIFLVPFQVIWVAIKCFLKPLGHKL